MALSRLTFSSNLLLIQNRLTSAALKYQKAAVPATTGLMVNTLSDDSSVISHLFSLRASSLRNEQFQRNITNVTSKIQFTDGQLAQSIDVLQRVREVTLRANDASNSSTALTQLNTQLGDLKTELMGYANAQLNNRYVFSGTATTTQPFTSSSGVVSFSSSANSTINSEYLSPTLTMAGNLDGNALFTGTSTTAASTALLTNCRNSNGVSLGIAAGNTITIAGSVGATAVSTTYTVTSTSTLADLASALQTALRAVADGDTTETATVTSGKIRVATDATNAITNLTLSISGNSTFNTAFTYSTTIAAGGNTADSNALKTAVDGEDIFDVIDDIVTAISAQSPTDIATHLARLDLGINQLSAARAKVGTRLQQLEAAGTFINQEDVRISQDLSNLQDAPMDKVLSDLVTRETALRMVYSSSQRILSAANMSLMNN